ncbi:Uncharacterised protein [Porphyromonas macacae]|uniref:Uncharacterized protein n=1 Tax=Porphyromonas macacae TaxID=28115 RepID=A0A379E8T3_9PORP|nr:hypothetical protein [Porphyromonas macacae]SUB89103.1 Uncharacterised protein [Porphyromonas macacae]
MKKRGLCDFHLQPLQTIAMDKLFPFQFSPIGNDKPVDGGERSPFLVLGNTDFATFFPKLSLV